MQEVRKGGAIDDPVPQALIDRLKAKLKLPVSGEPRPIVGSHLPLAVGRRPNTDSLAERRRGVEVFRGAWRRAPAAHSGLMPASLRISG